MVGTIVHGKVGGRAASTSGYDGDRAESPQVGKRTLVEASAARTT
jgi:hypothetical protein